MVEGCGLASGLTAGPNPPPRTPPHPVRFAVGIVSFSFSLVCVGPNPAVGVRGVTRGARESRSRFAIRGRCGGRARARRALPARGRGGDPPRDGTGRGYGAGRGRRGRERAGRLRGAAVPALLAPTPRCYVTTPHLHLQPRDVIGPLKGAGPRAATCSTSAPCPPPAPRPWPRRAPWKR